MRKTIITIILFLIIVLPASAYYNPGTPTGFVNDYANVIEDSLQAQMENKLIEFEKETSNEISIVTIKNLYDDYIENFSEKLFKEWGIGKTDKDNGVLVLVAVEDRKMRIEVGYGLEGTLTDAQSNWIINNEMKPHFQAENYGMGIDLAVDKIIDATKGEYVPSSSETSASKGSQGNAWNWEFIFWIVMFGFMWLSAILGRSKSWWVGGIIGGVAGVVLGLIWGWLWIGVSSIVGLGIFGLIFDYIVSKNYKKAKVGGKNPPWWMGGMGGFGGGRGGSSGGFGGFGGGFSGGGGSSGSW